MWHRLKPGPARIAARGTGRSPRPARSRSFRGGRFRAPRGRCPGTSDTRSQTFISSAPTSLMSSAPGTPLRASRLSATSSWRTIPFAAASSPILAAVVSVATSRSPSTELDLDPGLLESGTQPIHLRRARTDAAGRPCGELGGRRVLDELSAVDDHDLVGDLLDLGSTWLETRIVLPCEASERRSSRSQRMPCGSRPFAGSSRIEHLRVAEQRSGEAQPLAHAERVAARRAGRRRRSSSTSLEDLLDARERDARRGREHAQVIPSRSSRVEVGGLEHGADTAGRRRRARGRAGP